MTRTLAPDESREAKLRDELRGAYEHLGEITSRLLLVNEAAEASLASHDRVELSEGFLRVVCRGLEIGRAALFLVEGESFSVGATLGLSEEEQEQVPSSDADIEACGAALEAGHAHVADPELLTPEALEDVTRAAEESQEEEEAEESEDGDASEDGEAESEDEEEEEESEEEEEAEEDGEAEALETGAAPAAAEEESEDGEAEESAARIFGVFLPVTIEDEKVAVLAVGERLRGRAYRPEDLTLLRHLLKPYAVALARATLIEQNQERVRELDALLKVSREITSTLDLDSVLRAVVNTVGAVVENDRAEIALLQGDRLVLRAVSGMVRLEADQAEIFHLEKPLEWLTLRRGRVQIASDDLDDTPDMPGADVFRAYFEVQGMRSFMALPLRDEQGLLGYLCLESSRDSWDVAPSEGDALDIVAAQTTVAIRNAGLYSQIPLRGIAVPMARLSTRAARMTPRRRALAAALAAAVLLALVLPVFPDRPGGTAEVGMMRVQAARAPSPGVVSRVLVRGGEHVRAGQALAVLEDFDLGARIASLQASIEQARRGTASARLAGDVPTWRSEEVRRVALERTLAYELRRAGGAVLTAPFDGEVVELDLASRVGQHLADGEAFCRVAALDSVLADLQMPEESVGRLRPGQPVAVKVLSFPGHAFRGRVSEIGWLGRSDGRGRARFLVRTVIANEARSLRAGMSGIGRVTAGRRSLLGAAIEPLVRAARMSWW